MPNSVYAVVLCEGLQDWVFCRRALISLGIPGRDIYPVMSPDGKGSGEQFVRESYAKQVEASRARNARRRAALVVHTDADARTVVNRAASLATALAQASQPPRGPDEAIALLIPRRNIETWIHFYLSGPPIDEENAYPKFEGREAECWPAAEAFAANVRDRIVPPAAPPSLPVALNETRRVL